MRSATFVVDTTVLVDSGKAREPASSWLSSVARSSARVVISTVSMVEVLAGTSVGGRDQVVRLLRTLDAWPVTERVAVRAGIYRYDLACQGFDLKLPDAVIAATAEVAGAVLVTDNVRDFQRLGLPIMSPGDR